MNAPREKNNWELGVTSLISATIFVIAFVLTIFTWTHLGEGRVSLYTTEFISLSKLVSSTRMQGLLYDHESHEGVFPLQLVPGSVKSHFNDGNCSSAGWADVRCRSSKIPHLYHSKNGINGITFTSIHPQFMFAVVLGITASFSLLATFQNLADWMNDMRNSFLNRYVQVLTLSAWHGTCFIVTVMMYFNLMTFDEVGDIPNGNFIIAIVLVGFTWLYQVMVCLNAAIDGQEAPEETETRTNSMFIIDLLITMPIVVLVVMACGPLGLQQWQFQAVYITAYVFFSAVLMAHRIHSLQKVLKSGHYVWVPISVMLVSFLLFSMLLFEPLKVVFRNQEVIASDTVLGHCFILIGMIVSGISVLWYVIKYLLVDGTRYTPSSVMEQSTIGMGDRALSIMYRVVFAVIIFLAYVCVDVEVR